MGEVISVIAAVAAAGLGQSLWGVGMRSGDRDFLEKAALTMPLLSAALLIGFGVSELDERIGLAALLIFGAGAVVSPYLHRRMVVVVEKSES